MWHHYLTSSCASVCIKFMLACSGHVGVDGVDGQNNSNDGISELRMRQHSETRRDASKCVGRKKNNRLPPPHTTDAHIPPPPTPHQPTPRQTATTQLRTRHSSARFNMSFWAERTRMCSKSEVQVGNMLFDRKICVHFVFVLSRLWVLMAKASAVTEERERKKEATETSKGASTAEFPCLRQSPFPTSFYKIENFLVVTQTTACMHHAQRHRKNTEHRLRMLFCETTTEKNKNETKPGQTRPGQKLEAFSRIEIETLCLRGVNLGKVCDEPTCTSSATARGQPQRTNCATWAVCWKQNTVLTQWSKSEA